MKEFGFDMISALLWMKRGLFDRVTSHLRAVTVDLDLEQQIYICYFYYDAPIDDELFDLTSCAAAEASESWFCEEHILQLNFPLKIPKRGEYAFLRKEKGTLPPSVNLLTRSKECLPEAYLSYTLQQGLLGRVVSSLRAAIIDIDETAKTIWFYFFYDEKITEELKGLVQEAAAVAVAGFPSDYQALVSTQFIPYPQPIPDVGIRYVYKRKE